jgi:hypothetical protein
VTSATLRELGLPVAVEAAIYSTEGLAAAIVADAAPPVSPTDAARPGSSTHRGAIPGTLGR